MLDFTTIFFQNQAEIILIYQIKYQKELEALLYQNFNILQIYVIGLDLPLKKIGHAALIQNLVE